MYTLSRNYVGIIQYFITKYVGYHGYVGHFLVNYSNEACISKQTSCHKTGAQYRSATSQCQIRHLAQLLHFNFWQISTLTTSYSGEFIGAGSV